MFVRKVLQNRRHKRLCHTLQPNTLLLFVHVLGPGADPGAIIEHNYGEVIV